MTHQAFLGAAAVTLNGAMRSGNPFGSPKVIPAMIKINRGYTGTGDDRRTVPGDGVRLPKFDIRVAATGSLGEANAFIGWATRHASEAARAILRRNDLFDIGGDLCRPERPSLEVESLRRRATQVAWLEAHIEEHNETPRSLTSFVLPGRSEGSWLRHIVRTIGRRAEPGNHRAGVCRADHAGGDRLYEPALGSALRAGAGGERHRRERRFVASCCAARRRTNGDRVTHEHSD
jgi:cob(I)alamin adenosyltransferase